MKFNKLNSVRHITRTKYPPNWCCTIAEVSVHVKGHMSQLCNPGKCTRNTDFHLCAHVVILSCYKSPHLSVHYVSFLSLEHDPSCLPTFKPENKNTNTNTCSQKNANRK